MGSVGWFALERYVSRFRPAGLWCAVPFYRAGESDFTERFQERSSSNLGHHAYEHGARAGVAAESERHLTRWAAGHVETIGIGKLLRIAVRRSPLASCALEGRTTRRPGMCVKRTGEHCEW